MKQKKSLILFSGLFICLLAVLYLSRQTLMADNRHQVTSVTPVSFTDQVEFYGNIFTIDNTYTALCLDRSKDTPQTGTKVSLSTNSNPYIKKILYYGYKGPMEWSGFSGESEAILVTSIMLSQEYSGNGYKNICDSFKEYLDTMPDLPDYSISFSENNIGTYIENGVQRTKDITLTGDSRLSTNLYLDQEMIVHFSSGLTGTGNVTLHGGDTFYISAPLSCNGSWSSGLLSINEPGYQVIIATCESDTTQSLGYLIPDSDSSVTQLSVNWMDMGYIEILKQSLTPDIIQGNPYYSLENASYNVYSTKDDAINSTNSICTITTDSSGYGKSVAIPFGTYYIREVVSPKGFALSDEIITTSVNSIVSSPVTVSDSPILKPIEIKKYGEVENDLKSPLWGAGFMICPVSSLDIDQQGNYIWDYDCTIPLTESGEKEIFTNSGGYAVTIPLPYGTYLIKETTVPKNYLPMADTTVTINQNDNSNEKMIYLTDKSFKAYVKIVKTDSTTGNIILDNPATFKIWSFDSEKYVSFDIEDNGICYTLDEFCTDSEGTLITPQPLMPGKYLLEEICPPQGYYLNSPSRGYVLDISMDSDYEKYCENETPVDGVGIFTVTIENTPVRKKIQIVKKLEDPSYNGNFIPGADISFNIYAYEDIYSPGSKNLLFKKGELVETITTGADGICKTSKDLPLGTYTIEEASPPAGYESSPVKIVSLSQEAESMSDDPEIVTLTITNNLKPPLVLGETHTPATGDRMYIFLFIFLISALLLFLLRVKKIKF